MSRLKTILPGLGILALWALPVLILKPWSMDFPLDEDWAYAWGVSHLIQKGALRFSDWVSNPQWFQVFWGFLWVKILGLSFGALKISTLTAGGAAVVLLYRIMRMQSVPVFPSFLAACVLAFNPVFFLLSYSFMPDVPYLCLILLAVYFYLKARRPPSQSSGDPDASEMRRGNERKNLVWASLFSAVGTGVRYLGVFLPLGYGLRMASCRQWDRRWILIWALPLAAVSVYLAWFYGRHGPTWGAQAYLQACGSHVRDFPAFLGDLFFRFIGAFLEIGFFLFPLAVGFLACPKQFIRKKSPVVLPPSIYFCAVGWLFVLSIYLTLYGCMPHLEGVLHGKGLGPLYILDAVIKPAGFFEKQWLWIGITFLSMASLLVCTAAFLAVKSDSHFAPYRDSLWIFFVTSAAQALLPMGGPSYFDRYALALVPFGIWVLSIAATRWNFSKPFCILGLLFLGAFSMAGTQDYLACNRAKWDLGKRVIAKGILPNQVTNGFDWDAFWTYQPNMDRLKKIKSLGRIGENDWQALNPYGALVTYRADMPGDSYQLADQVSYRTWLHPSSPVPLYLWIGK